MLDPSDPYQLRSIPYISELAIQYPPLSRRRIVKPIRLISFWIFQRDVAIVWISSCEGDSRNLRKATTMKKTLFLLLGENQDRRMMVLMMLPPVFFVVFILLTYPMVWQTIVTAILAFDIFAGLLSNLQEKTHQAWKKQPKANLVAFVVLNLTIYPLAVVLFQVSLPLMFLMLAMLLTKTLGFAIGTQLWK